MRYKTKNLTFRTVAPHTEINESKKIQHVSECIFETKLDKTSTAKISVPSV